jgi:hypothetical protein
MSIFGRIFNAIPKGGFVMFSVTYTMKAEQVQGAAKEEQLGGFRRAALVAVSQ